jgi:hypothetical protein
MVFIGYGLQEGRHRPLISKLSQALHRPAALFDLPGFQQLEGPFDGGWRAGLGAAGE